MMKILLIGPQGSGKSTQAKLLAEKLGIPKISTGDIFRQISTSDTDEGKRIKNILNSGNLIDDQTTAKQVEERLKQSDVEDGFILDGYPRNKTQLQMFDPGFDKVIYLKVPDEEVINRMAARGRQDDTPEIIRTRLNIYNQQTKPLLDYYKTQNILLEVDGLGSVEDIFKRIEEILPV